MGAVRGELVDEAGAHGVHEELPEGHAPDAGEDDPERGRGHADGAEHVNEGAKDEGAGVGGAEPLDGVDEQGGGDADGITGVHHAGEGVGVAVAEFGHAQREHVAHGGEGKKRAGIYEQQFADARGARDGEIVAHFWAVRGAFRHFDFRQMPDKWQGGEKWQAKDHQCFFPANNVGADAAADAPGKRADEVDGDISGERPVQIKMAKKRGYGGHHCCKHDGHQERLQRAHGHECAEAVGEPYTRAARAQYEAGYEHSAPYAGAREQQPDKERREREREHEHAHEPADAGAAYAQRAADGVVHGLRGVFHAEAAGGDEHQP